MALQLDLGLRTRFAGRVLHLSALCLLFLLSFADTSVTCAYICWLFGGLFGAHRFLVGRVRFYILAARRRGGRRGTSLSLLASSTFFLSPAAGKRFRLDVHIRAFRCWVADRRAVAAAGEREKTREKRRGRGGREIDKRCFLRWFPFSVSSFLLLQFVEEHNKRVFNRLMMETSSVFFDGDMGTGASFYPQQPHHHHHHHGGGNHPFAGAVAPYAANVYFPAQAQPGAPNTGYSGYY